MSVILVPCIHLNGTSSEELLRQNTEVARAVQEAMRALSNAAPNGRDFYVLGNDALKKAQAEHRARWDKLESVYDELLIIIDGIEEQKG